MKIAYSCVVDAQPKFDWQALLWVNSLLRNGCDAEVLKVPFSKEVSVAKRTEKYFERNPIVITLAIICWQKNGLKKMNCSLQIC